MTPDSYRLARWTIKLGGEVRSLQQQTPYLSASALDTELKRYRSTLRYIYAEAEQQQVDLMPYYDALADIEARLKTIEVLPQQAGPVEKIALFIDGANLSAMAFDQLHTRIDLTKLRTYFSRNAIIVRAFYYLATERDVNPSMRSFLIWLGRNGYQVVTKLIKEFEDGSQKGNLDIEIAIDMLELAEKVDRVVLFSGDGDFAPLLKRVGRKGTRTQVVAYWGQGEGPTAPELLGAADIFTELQDIIELIARD